MKIKKNILEAVGIELEYMIVDKETLKVSSSSNQLIERINNSKGEAVVGELGISNELVSHVIELKNEIPFSNGVHKDEVYAQSIKLINNVLNKDNKQLLSTGMHPFMNPKKETVLFSKNNKKIYETYHSLFNCYRHGWANVQSTHINLSFSGKTEFDNLHNSSRLLLAVIPGIAASSPMYEGGISKYSSSRMFFYKTNSSKIPSITGKVIPPVICSKKEYQEKILSKMYQDTSFYPGSKILLHEWLNARGSIARFDRNAIELRVMDIQEAPLSDFAIASLIYSSLKNMVFESSSSSVKYKKIPTSVLYAIMNKCIKEGEHAVIEDANFLSCFNIAQRKVTVGEFWGLLFYQVNDNNSQELSAKYKKVIEVIQSEGTLSTRLIRALGKNPTHQDIIRTYSEVGNCLNKNRLFK